MSAALFQWLSALAPGAAPALLALAGLALASLGLRLAARLKR